MNTLKVTTKSISFQFGERNALAGTVRNPSDVFLQKADQAEYAAGVASVNKPAPIIVPNYKRNGGREYVRKTDSLCYEQQVKMIEARQARIDRMIALTASLTPEYAGDILWAV